MIPYRITEKAVEVIPGGELDENRGFAPLHGKCDKCETDFAPDSNLKLHKTVYPVKFTRVQSVMRG